MEKVPLIAICTLIACLLTGCGTTAKFVYPADSKALTKASAIPIAKKKVVVTPFDDLRGDSNQIGTLWLYLIPLMPGGAFTYERPDAARMFNTISAFEFTPSEDLAKAAAYSLRQSNLFEDAFFSYGADKDKADFQLKGEIHSTTYDGYIVTYGLSVFGPMLWFIGLPAGSSYNEIDLRLSLVDLQTGHEVWSRRTKMDDKITQGLYYKFGHDVRGYAKLMQQTMNEAVGDIHQKILSGQIPTSPTPTTTTTTPAPEKTNPTVDQDVSAQLKKLIELKDAGLITEDEFSAKRKSILENL